MDIWPHLRNNHTMLDFSRTCYLAVSLLLSQMLYHGLRGSVSPALTATGLVNGKEQILTQI